ncbi:hypothetical protein SCOR_30640 [Sulfidibacter corallicola]|uniref:Photosynthesis system II assembly factor Ycf48/Hcf136-like domain-containing protein n=1 Tax=Sulfidibacter corallicola TaxID=2818388 RepID=A0A8A4TJI8_SULCO|nr:hypothetical protein [Sulfidibacter corallicola]QTD50086.1 hypothetical protein J3U87_31260 [Sulfidibacter corallicola]
MVQHHKYLVLKGTFLLCLLFSSTFSPAQTNPDWTTHGLEGEFHDLVAGANGYVLVGEDTSGTGAIWYSGDGELWGDPVTTTDQRLEHVAWSGTAYVAAGRNGILSSSDGEAWLGRPFGSEGIQSLIWDGSRFLALLMNDAVLSGSANGQNWSQILDPPGFNLLDMASNGNRIVCVTHGNLLVGTLDGQWQTLPITVEDQRDQFLTINWNGSRFLARGEDGLTATSEDGLNWSVFDNENGDTSRALIWDGQKYIEIDTTSLRVSLDGVEWTSSPLPLRDQESPHNLVRAGDRYFFLAGSERLLASEDLQDWHHVSPKLTTDYRGKWLDDRLFWMGTNMLNTTDARTWYPLDARVAMRDVTTNGTRFVAVGDSGTVYLSDNTIDWREYSTGSALNLTSVVFADNRFWALGGDAGYLFSSADGTAWRTENQRFSANSWLYHLDDTATVVDSKGTWRLNNGSWQLSAQPARMTATPLGNGLHYLALDDEDLVFSRDGRRWSSAHLPPEADSVTSLCRIDSAFLITTDADIRYSFDGLAWQTLTTDVPPFTPIWLGAIGDASIAVDATGRYAIHELTLTPPPELIEPTLVVPWIVNNEQWSSRVAFFNRGDTFREVLLRAVTSEGLVREATLDIPAKGVTARTADMLFPELSGYSLFVVSESSLITASFLTFNNEVQSGGESPSQTVGQPVDKTTDTLLFPYLPGDQVAAVVLVAPEARADRTPVLLQRYRLDGTLIDEASIELTGSQPTALLMSDTFPQAIDDDETEFAVRATARNGALLSGTTFVFNQNRQPSMAAALPLEVTP